MKVKHIFNSAKRRLIRTRKKVRGSTERPRLCVVRTNKHLYVQLIDDVQGKTLVAANDIEKTVRKSVDGKQKIEKARTVATNIAQKMKAAKIKAIVFDRGKARFHGRVKVIADVLREEGFQF